ncbi:hypothetical protein HBH99_256610 [Parastagonospora nodorum]|nr:hypothetical protein HBH99_256610 [Parastagonospora nodorum]
MASGGLEKFAKKRIMATPGSKLPVKDDQFFMKELYGKEGTDAKMHSSPQ